MTQKLWKTRKLREWGSSWGLLKVPWPGVDGRGSGGLEGRSWEVLAAGGTRGRGGKTQKSEKYKVKNFLMARTDSKWVRLKSGWWMQSRGGLGRSKQQGRSRRREEKGEKAKIFKWKFHHQGWAEKHKETYPGDKEIPDCSSGGPQINRETQINHR
jgi:hypothetical protein